MSASSTSNGSLLLLSAKVSSKSVPLYLLWPHLVVSGKPLLGLPYTVIRNMADSLQFVLASLNMVLPATKCQFSLFFP